jgi:hypothetical protein
MANAVANGAHIVNPASGTKLSPGLAVQRFDWLNAADLQRVLEAGPFDMVLGAALQFESWWDKLWPLLEKLASSQSTRLVLVHTTGNIVVPAAAALCEVRRKSGKIFGMVTRQNEFMSDFEVVELVARAPGASNCRSQHQGEL